MASGHHPPPFVRRWPTRFPVFRCGAGLDSARCVTAVWLLLLRWTVFHSPQGLRVLRVRLRARLICPYFAIASCVRSARRRIAAFLPSKAASIGIARW